MTITGVGITAGFWVAMVGVTLGATGCAHTSKARVIQLENGKTEVVAAAQKESDAAVAAVDRANEYCENRKQEAIFASDDPNKACDSRESGTLGLLKRLPVVKDLVGQDEPKEQRVSMSFRCRAPSG